MSYAVSAALQVAVYGRLAGFPALSGVPVHDAVPAGGGTGTFVLIGPEEVVDQSDKTGDGAEHRLMISVISDATGFLAAKTAAVAVSDALVDANLTLSRGVLISMLFVKASARRIDEGDTRRIDLTFRARVQG
ncbi:MAG: DUF3168 domain-containing protein [Rhodobacteraceae bacterium]|jgi:Protein of unknown function (DUF3168)|nr:DUF3168 domain-containing protein [Paracoccaceae bacterium]